MTTKTTPEMDEPEDGATVGTGAPEDDTSDTPDADGHLSADEIMAQVFTNPSFSEELPDWRTDPRSDFDDETDEGETPEAAALDKEVPDRDGQDESDDEG